MITSRGQEVSNKTEVPTYFLVEIYSQYWITEVFLMFQMTTDIKKFNTSQ